MKALRVSERIRATRNFSLPAGYDDQCEPHFIVRRDAAQLWDARTGRVPGSEGGHYNPVSTTLSGLELGVAFDEFFCAAAGEAHGEAAVVFISFDTDDGADAVFGMANFAAEHGVGWGAAGKRTNRSWGFPGVIVGGRKPCGGETPQPAGEFV